MYRPTLSDFNHVFIKSNIMCIRVKVQNIIAAHLISLAICVIVPSKFLIDT